MVLDSVLDLVHVYLVRTYVRMYVHVYLGIVNIAEAGRMTTSTTSTWCGTLAASTEYRHSTMVHVYIRTYVCIPMVHVYLAKE
jgi:hypothetical protein